MKLALSVSVNAEASEEDRSNEHPFLDVLLHGEECSRCYDFGRQEDTQSESHPD